MGLNNKQKEAGLRIRREIIAKCREGNFTRTRLSVSLQTKYQSIDWHAEELVAEGWLARITVETRPGVKENAFVTIRVGDYEGSINPRSYVRASEFQIVHGWTGKLAQFMGFAQGGESADSKSYSMDDFEHHSHALTPNKSISYGVSNVYLNAP